MAQQIQPFERLGKEFARQHFGSEERRKGLTPEQLEHLKELLQQQTKADDKTAPR
jgi:hypothetical protein